MISSKGTNDQERSYYLLFFFLLDWKLMMNRTIKM